MSKPSWPTTEPEHDVKPPFTDAQLAHLDKMFHALGMDIQQQAHSDYTRNDAAREAVWGVAHAVQCFEPRQVEP